MPRIDLRELRERMTRNKHMLARFRNHAAKLGLSYSAYMHRRCVLDYKWCHACKDWRKHADFHRDSTKYDHCQADCNRHQARTRSYRRHKQRHARFNVAWSTREEMLLQIYAGRLSSQEIADKLGRSKGAVLKRARKLGLSTRLNTNPSRAIYLNGAMLRDLLDMGGDTTPLVQRWSELGMSTEIKAGVHVVTRKQLRHFLSLRPEALDVRRLDPETRDILDLADDPRPSWISRKRVQCGQCGHIHTLRLYEGRRPKQKQCPTCQERTGGFAPYLPYWSTHGYVHRRGHTVKLKRRELDLGCPKRRSRRSRSNNTPEAGFEVELDQPPA